jgi:hypothetical protein
MPASSESQRFGAAVACIDGRTHEPLTRWIRERTGVRYVDLVTEPGADAALADCPRDTCATIRERLRVSLTAHAPEIVVIAGHDDCAANPVSTLTHRDQVRAAVGEVAGWGLGVPVVGVWIDDDGEVEPIAPMPLGGGRG